MNKKLFILALIAIFVILGIVYFTTKVEEVDEMDQARETAEQWMIDSAETYVFDGYDLEIISEEEIEGGYEFLFSYETKAGGYGDRTEEMVAQVITPRETLVVVQDDEVVSAVTDQKYDELEQRIIEEDEAMVIELYFGKYGEDNGVFSQEREVEKREDVARAALEELLKGPEDEDYFTSIPEGVIIQGLEIEEGLAKVDFSSELEEGVAGSATVTAIREQIEKTLLQFPTIEEVEISIDDRTEDILQP